MVVIKKHDINLLINSLIKTGGGQNPYGKMSEILKFISKSEDIRVLRGTLLLWLDSMNIFDVDFQYQPPKYVINKPRWTPGTIHNHYNLLGALTLSEINRIDNNPFVKKITNKTSFLNLEIELPDTYYTEDIQFVENLGFDIAKNTTFSNIENDDDADTILKKLIDGDLLINILDGNKKISFIKDDTSSSVYIENQDDVQIFDWVTRKYYKCNLENELNDEEGIKLIKVGKKYLEAHIEIYTILLTKEIESEWKYLYFDPKKVDERWAIYIYLSTLTHYDLHRGADIALLVQMFTNNLKTLKRNSLIAIEDGVGLNRKNIIKIPTGMLKQIIHYDKRKGILAIPVSIPLPKIFMKYLFSCSGTVPQVFQNSYSLNPKYLLKVLYSGSISEGGKDIFFPDESYFMHEYLYLFTSIPSELAETISSKLGLDYYKRTFYTRIN